MEFDKAESLERALQSTRSPPIDRIIPVHSPFVWLSASQPAPRNRKANIGSSTDIIQETVPSDEELQLQLSQSRDVRVLSFREGQEGFEMLKCSFLDIGDICRW